MALWKALIIGLLQGLTEFLPVSSSAHLWFAKIFLGVQTGEQQVLFDLMCHLGTLVAALYFLWDDIVEMFRVKREMLYLLLIALLPLIPFYFLLKPLRDFASQGSYVGYCLLLTSCILFFGGRFKFRALQTQPPTFRQQVYDVLWIGTMQATALIPGISRSASTISTANVLGWTPRSAVRFSFLLSIPTIIGGNCLELLKIAFSSQALPDFSFSSCFVGFTTSCVVGLIVIRYAINILEKGNLKPFAWYCLIVGAIATIYMNLLYV